MRCQSVYLWLYCMREFDGVRYLIVILFFKQKTAYEMRISDWSSDVCSSDLTVTRTAGLPAASVSLTAMSLAYDSPTARVRSEERRVGKECVSTCRYRWSP